MALVAPQVEPLADLQLAMTAGRTTQEADLAALIDRLGNRLGFARLAQAWPRESHFPERAAKRMPAVFPAAPGKPAAVWPAKPLPLRLLARPEPVTAEATGSDRPPSAFLWRSRRHRVRHAEGPARIEPEWWRGESGSPRDYWRLENEQGERFWVYGQSGSWYLHGLFA
jgi:protein ImuB